jgi:hypothetical protein
MNETSKQPPSDEAPPGDEPQPLRTEDQARVAKLAAEEALIREQLKRAELENNAAEREAKTWHRRYTFVPSPRVALQAIVAGVVMVIALFAFYQPLVDRVKNETIKTAKIAEKNAKIAQLDADIQKHKTELTRQENERVNTENERVSNMLDAKETELTNLRKDLLDKSVEFEEQLAESKAKHKEDLDELENKLAEAPQSGEQTGRLRNQLNAASTALSETTKALKSASIRTNQLRLPYEKFPFNPRTEKLWLKNKEEFNPKKQITLEAWFKAKDFNKNQWIVFKPFDRSNKEPYYQYVLGFRAGKKGIVFGLALRGKGRVRIDGAFKKALKINEWHHVAATYDGDSMMLYLDGKKWSKSKKVSSSIANYNTNLGIGGRVKPTSGGSLNEVFQGELSEVRIWEVARTEEQIRANMNKTIPPETNDLVWSSDDYFAKKNQ